MNQEFINELEQLIHQKINSKPTEIGFLIEINPKVVLHFILLSQINTNFNLVVWKTQHQLQHAISIFEDEWINKKELVLSRIKSKLELTNKIFARKTTVVKLNRVDAFEFLADNHINVPVKAKYNYGLVFNNEIVAIACFGPIMHKKTEGKGDMSGELIRFCNKLDYTVVGGLSKLLAHFIKKHQVNDIMTYIDRDWSDGKSFIKLGFEIVGENTSFTHYLNQEINRFEPKNKQNENQLIVYKSGLLKLLLKVY
ncbi:MAG: hypothetical protein AB7O47_02140 [Flavobacteriales bacterium]